MKFSEFKQAMLRHNELVLALKLNGAKSEWKEELDNLNKIIYEFYNYNPDALAIEICFLANWLKKFMRKNPEINIVRIFFQTQRIDRDRIFAMNVTLKDADRGHFYPKCFYLGRIFDAETGHAQYAFLADNLNYESSIRDKAVNEIPGLEDALWQVAEEYFNKQIEKQINLLTKTRKKIEEKKNEIQQPDYVEKQLAELNSKEKDAIDKIAMLEAQLG